MNQTIYPIGIQNFESLRKDGYLYIDKTALIYQLANTGRYYSSAVPSASGKAWCYPPWRPISKERRSCSRDWPWRSWRKSDQASDLAF